VRQTTVKNGASAARGGGRLPQALSSTNTDDAVAAAHDPPLAEKA